MNTYYRLFKKQLKWLSITYLKLAFTPGTHCHNNHFNLCGQLENSKWILCSQKTGVKCEYLRFLVEKISLVKFKIYNICTTSKKTFNMILHLCL